MSDNIKIWGYSENKKTIFKFDHKEVRKHTVGLTSGKAVFDFIYIKEEDLYEVFSDIQASFFYDAHENAKILAGYYSESNSCLAAYIAEFLEFFADGSEEASRKLTNFAGSYFIAPNIDDPDCDEKLIYFMVESIKQKQQELRALINKVFDEEDIDGRPIKEYFIRAGKTNKLADFRFNCFLSSEMTPLMFPLKTADDVIRFDLMQMFAKDLEFKACRNCLQYFVPSGRTDSEYCDRMHELYGKTCKEIGALKTFERSHKNDPIHKAYITAYRRMDSRKRAKIVTNEEFKEFGKMARAERKKCYDGEITLEQFKTWLDDFR